MDVRQIDPEDEAAFADWFAVLRATDLERWPDKPGWQRAERLAWALDQDGPEEHRCLVATDMAGAVVGIADLEMYRRENRHLARVDVRVLPQARRQGVGTAIVQAAGKIARALGRNELGGMDEKPMREDVEDAAGPFARHLGFAPAQEMVRRELQVPLSKAKLEALASSPRANIDGYTLMTFADRWPDEYIADRCELGRRMSTDVPMGEQELDEELYDEARVRQIEATLAAMDRSKVSTAAREVSTGKLVAFTEVVVPLGAPASAWQHDTLVMREHRGHNLGYALKLTNASRVCEMHPDVRTISTWNAAENAHMIAINEQLGYEVAATSTYWLKKFGAE